MVCFGFNVFLQKLIFKLFCAAAKSLFLIHYLIKLEQKQQDAYSDCIILYLIVRANWAINYIIITLYFLPACSIILLKKMLVNIVKFVLLCVNSLDKVLD